METRFCHPAILSPSNGRPRRPCTNQAGDFLRHSGGLIPTAPTVSDRCARSGLELSHRTPERLPRKGPRADRSGSLG
jgi:hypothetical protein